jgi:TPR repeat protein
VLKDDKQAASWYQKAAEQENAGLIPLCQNHT